MIFFVRKIKNDFSQKAIAANCIFLRHQQILLRILILYVKVQHNILQPEKRIIKYIDFFFSFLDMLN